MKKLFIGWLSGLFLLAFSSQGATIYVKSNASGANSGSSWANAYTNLQPAIDSAVSGDQVWVAAGTYKPNSWPNGGAGERYKHFSLKTGVAVYGGFSGVESLLISRDINKNKVICSGDIGVVGDNSDNCYQVFYHPFGTGLDNTAVIDGVTITGGNANGSTPYNFGGGMYNSGCNPTISKCTFTSNGSSASGGGMYNYGCAPVVSYSSFLGNSAVDGGGIYNSNSSSTNVSGSFFSGNTASASGGGMFNTDSNPSVVNNTFVSNTAVNGGGIYNYFSFPALNNCTFTGNTASSNGGGIYCQYNSASTPVFTVKNCIFWNNGGAGKEIYKTSITASVSYCVVQGGFTGGTNIITTDPLLYTPCLNGGFTNTCAITNASSAVFIPKSAASNTWNGSSSYDQRGSVRAPSASRAAGAYEPSYGYPSILTTAISEITKTSAVSGISFPDSGSGYTVTQKGVCWAETPGPTVNGSKTTDGAGVTLATSTITGLTEDTDYYLRAYAQLNDGTVMYGQEIKFKSLMIFYVVVGGAGNIDGTSWDNALGDLQVAISMSSTGDEVWVAQGIYKPQTWPNGGSDSREKHFSLKKGVKVYGGFIGNETSLGQRDYKTNVTTLSGDIGTIGNNTDNCYHVFYHPSGLGLDNNTVIDGFSITAGYADNFINEFNGIYDKRSCGAGMFNKDQSLKIYNCIFSDNFIHEDGVARLQARKGAAIYNVNSNVDIINSNFQNNAITSKSGYSDSDGCGGAIYNAGGTVNIQYCSFESNSVITYGYSPLGGAIFSENTILTISSCLFKNNFTELTAGLQRSPYGGAIYNRGLYPVIKNSTFTGNSTRGAGSQCGGAIFNDNTSAIINSCTFNSNIAWAGGGAIYNSGGSPTIKNSLLWGNGGTGIEINGTVGTVSYCVVEGDYAGGSNIITSDPQLQTLADNGGYTQTIAIPGNSSAVAIPQYAGSNDWNGSPYLDQRDYGKRLTGVRAIGAYDPNSKASFAVNFSSGGNGSLSGTASQTVTPMGSTTVVTANPNTNYTFNGWTGDYVGNENPLTISNVVKDMSVTANFTLKTYTVSFAPGMEGGSIGGTATQTIQHGGSCTTVTAAADTGYHFVNWTGDYSGTTNPLTITNVTANKTITANFAINTYTLTYNAGANGTVTGTSPQTVNYGSSGAAVTAVANTGYHFTGWSDAVATASRTDTNITANKTVTANFAINTYTVTFDLSGKGTRSGGGALSQTINHGSGATAPTVTPNAGWTFSGWDKTFSNITDNTTVTALYSVATYTVTFVQGVNGTITGTKVQTVSHGNSSTEVTAVPSTGYHFVNWTGGLTSTANPLTVSNVTAAMTITANFAINTYALEYAAGSNGTLTGSTSQTVNHGANGTAVTAVPNTGYHFAGWSDGVINNPRTDLTVTAAKSVTVNFALNTVEILTDVTTLNVPELGTAVFKVKLSAQPTTSVTVSVNWISGDTDISVSSGSSLTFSTANWGTYQNVTLAVAKDTDAANGSATITCSASGLADKSVTATEIDNDYTLTVSNDGNGTTSPSGANIVQKGSAKSIAATPSTGYHFVNWTVTSGTGSFGNANSATTTFTASANATIRANFVINTYTLNFNSGSNGKVTGITPQTINHGANGTAATAEPNTGYHFTNWSGDYAGTQNPLTVNNVISNKAMTANFAINTYTVTFNLDGKGARTGGGELVQMKNHGSAAIAPTVVAAAGWTFSGWDKAFDNITSELVVNAQYNAATYTVTYDAEGGTVSPPSKIVTYNAAYGTLETPTRNGYTFAGWWTDDNGTGTQVTEMTTVTKTANHTIYAKWTANTYTVNYDAEGGTVSPSSKIVTFGSAYGALTSPTRNGYAFAGWWTGDNGTGAKVSSSTIVGIAANHTIYAKWIISVVGLALELPLPPEFEGLNVTVKGLPAGVKYNALTRMITGVPTKPGVYIVEISAPGVPSQTITIGAGALPAWTYGSFNGWGVDGNDHGTATMTVTALGKVTGKLSAGGKNYAFSAASYARRDDDGAFWISTEITVDKVDVPLIFKVTNPAGVVPPTLSVVEGWFSDEANGDSAVKMYRNVWKDTGAAAILEPYIGYYTAVLPGGAEYGSGYLAITVDKAGAVKTTGKLADGMVLSLSGALILDETGRIFTVIYTSPTAYKGGCLFGLVEFVKPVKPEDGGKVFLRLLGGIPFNWENLNIQATGDYGSGFLRTPGLSGGWYDKLINLQTYYANGLSVGNVNVAPIITATVSTTYWGSDDNGNDRKFTDRVPTDVGATCWNPGGLVLTVTDKGLVPLNKPETPKKDPGTGEYNYDLGNATGLTISLMRATGIFRGSFNVYYDYMSADNSTLVNPAQTYSHVVKKASYEGVLLSPERENPADGIGGRGFYLWPDKSTYDSGKVDKSGEPIMTPYSFNWSYDFIIQSQTVDE